MRNSFAIGLLLAGFVTAAVAQNDVEVLHFEQLPDANPALTGTSTYSKPQVAAAQLWTFNAFGKQFDVALEPNAGLAALMRDLQARTGIAAYRGALAGNNASWVRIVTTPYGPTGLIWDGQDLYGIEHRKDSAVSSEQAVIFRLDDMYISPGTISCGADASAPATGGQAFSRLREEMTAFEAQGATMNLDIGAVADFEFYQAFGEDSSAAILARANNIDGIFSGQLGIQINVAQIDVFSESADPFTSTDAQTLLDEVANYRGSTPTQDAQGLTHLFTGRDLDGTTAGIAFLGVVCSTRNPFGTESRSFGVGLSEGRRGAVVDSLVAAHEIGHNFGAPHDAESGSACQSTPATFLMAPSISGFDQFSTCSIDEMQPEIVAASCLTAIGDPDLSLVALVPNPTVPANTAYDYVFEVTNMGAEVTSSATVEASFDGNLEILSATASAGSCNLGTSTVSCALGDVPGGSMRSVRVTLRSAAPGQYSVTAIADSASSDANPDNDQSSGNVTVVPIVDLVLSAGTATLTTDQSAAVQVALSNDSDFAASALVLSASFSTDLRLESASLGGATCVVSGQNMTCNLASLNAGSQTQLSLQLTGLAGGNEQGTLNVTADEDDRNAANNSALLSIEINDATIASPQDPAEEGGGGGSASWLWFLLTLPALLQRRCRPRLS